MTDVNLVGPWVRRFLMEHLVGERNLAHNTQVSYRDTMILLLPFAAATISKSIERLALEHLSPDLIRQFLLHLEHQRGCSVATRNQRLAAIHAFSRYVGEHSPEYLDWRTQIRAIPFKKTSSPVMSYLDKTEMDALLDVPTPPTPQGLRDYTLLLFLYNTGSRADEVTRVTVADLELGRSPVVKITGKGSKVRFCPLWRLTADKLGDLIADRTSTQHVFFNCRGQKFTRFGVYALVKRYAL